ncbi:MAG: type I 3-dehydroquinate dehydratase [Spirochaetaceae bacterium]|nr:type I 3-dehydroquinate dehydratase [Spirochaetaceae bacterium]
MQRPYICLCLTGKTLSEDLEILNRYRNLIDIAELRVDYLEKNEQLHIRRFPELAGIPCILTIRRVIDGGKFIGGEASRTTLFARGLAFADQDTRKNFAYVDFEEDYYVPSLQDAALAFGTRIIRSCHNMEGPIYNIEAKLSKMRTTGFEIPKIACMPKTLSDVTRMFKEAATLKDTEQILCAMGPLGLPTRILASKMNSFLTFVSPVDSNIIKTVGHIDPVTMQQVYNFSAIDENTKIYGITGYPLSATDSPVIHNNGYKAHGMNAVYIPVRAQNIEDALDFANNIGMDGLSITIPHKESVIEHIADITPKVSDIGACNTIVRNNSTWTGYNTDADGLIEALKEFLNTDTLARKKVSIIGAGGAARAAAYAVKQLKGKACIFNRTATKAKYLAADFGFKYAHLSYESVSLIEKYSDLIIQTTSKGMGSSLPPTEENDPLFFYDFKGYEALYDIIYVPEITPVMARASSVGCRVANGKTMLEYQAYRQFKLFTGEEYK